jgi:hypothetical protein
MQLKSALLSLCAFGVLTSELPAQQHRGWPLCGITEMDSLSKVQSVVIIRAWREEQLGPARSGLVDSLRATLKGTVSRLTRSTDSTATARPRPGSRTGILWLELGVGRPRNRVTAIGGNWLLQATGDTGTGQLSETTIAWQKTGPHQVIPVDSLIEGIRTEARRLIGELPSTLEQCRRFDKMPLDIRR